MSEGTFLTLVVLSSLLTVILEIILYLMFRKALLRQAKRFENLKNEMINLQDVAKMLVSAQTPEVLETIYYNIRRIANANHHQIYWRELVMLIDAREKKR